jgi:hypothetical protein
VNWDCSADGSPEAGACPVVSVCPTVPVSADPHGVDSVVSDCCAARVELRNLASEPHYLDHNLFYGTPQYRLKNCLIGSKENKTEEIEKVLKKWPDLWRCSDTYALLVSYGFGDLARKELITRKAKLIPIFTEVEMTREFEQQAEKWIASFDKPKDALFAKLVMYARKDSKSEKGKLKLTKEQRLRAVAEEFLSMRFDFHKLEFAMLDNLMNYECVAGMVADRAVVLARSINNDFFESLLKARFPGFNFRLAEFYYIGSVSKGDPKLVLDFVEKAADICRDPSKRHLQGRACDALQRIMRSLKRDWGRRTQPSKEYTAAMLKIYDTIYSVFLDFDRKDRPALNLVSNVDTYVCLLLATGKVEQFDKHMAKMTESDLKIIYRLQFSIPFFGNAWPAWEYVPANVFLTNFTRLLQTDFYKWRIKDSGLGEDIGMAYFFQEVIRSGDIDWLLNDIESTLLLDQPLMLTFRDAVKLFDRGFFLSKSNMPQFVSFIEKSLGFADTEAEKALILSELAFYCGRYKMPEVFNEYFNRYFPSEKTAKSDGDTAGKELFDVTKSMPSDDVRRHGSGVVLFKKVMMNAPTKRAEFSYFGRVAYVLGQGKYSRREQMDKIVKVFFDVQEKEN